MAPVVHGLEHVYGDYIKIYTIDITPYNNPEFYSGLDIDKVADGVEEIKTALAPDGDVRVIEGQRPYIVLVGPGGEIINVWSFFTDVKDIQAEIIRVLNQ